MMRKKRGEIVRKIMKRKYQLFIALAFVAFIITGCAENNSPTGNVALEQKSQADTIEIKGSDTLLQMVSNMAEAYMAEAPGAKISVTGGGSGAGIASLINGEIPIADASRKIKGEELIQAQAKGMDVQEFIIARDMLSVIVNKDNPVSQLTMEQVASIFKGEITNWEELGGKDQPITLYGRQSTSGTYAFFMEHVLKGDYSPKMMNLEGNQAILDAIKQDKTSIGYVGIGYLRDEKGNVIGGIKVLSIALDDASDYITPFDKTKLEEYPVSRELFQYFANPPAKGSALHGFLMYELSKEGQELVEKSGYISILPGDQEHNDALLAKI